MPTCYAALDDRVLVVDGDDGDWSARERLVESDVECVAASPAAPERILVGTADSGLERSTDGGDAWESTLSAGDRITSVTVAPSDPDVVWAGTEPSAVYRSTDGGETWTERPGLTDLPSASDWSFPPRPNTHHVRWIAVAPDDPDRLYVAIEAGALVVSTGGGGTWIDRPEGSRYDNHTLATHPDAPERVYSAAGDGYAESFDRGETWHHPQSGLDHRYVWGLAVAPDDPDAVYVSAASGARSAHDPRGTSYVYRRTIRGDGGGRPDGDAADDDAADDDAADDDATGDDPANGDVASAGGARSASGGPSDGDAPFDGGERAADWHRAMDGLPGPEGWARPVLAAGDGDVYALTNHGLFVSTGERSWDLLSLHWPGEYTRGVPRGLAVV